MPKQKVKVTITSNGPYVVSGEIDLQQEIIVNDNDGNPIEWKQSKKYPVSSEYALCRCGGSKNKPFCDGSHIHNKFDGTETATQESYEVQAEITNGSDLDLVDVPQLCAAAGFCHRAGGTWNLTKKSNDPEAKNMAIEQACHCPSGRLVVQEKNGKSIEPKFSPSISLVEEPEKGVSGPLWLKGGIELESADGSKYETRNRMTICRCGKSNNKPFCDGTHQAIGFNDEIV